MRCCVWIVFIITDWQSFLLQWQTQRSSIRVKLHSETNVLKTHTLSPNISTIISPSTELWEINDRKTTVHSIWMSISSQLSTKPALFTVVRCFAFTAKLIKTDIKDQISLLHQYSFRLQTCSFSVDACDSRRNLTKHIQITFTPKIKRYKYKELCFA